MQAHWGLKDPSSIEGDEETINAAFSNTITILQKRIKKIHNWIKQGLDKDELFKRIKALATEAYIQE